VSLVNGGQGGGETVPPTSSGSGTVSLIESTDGSVTVTDGEGPTVDLTGAGGGGGVSSFNTRTGAVVSVSGDYNVAEVTGAAPLASPAFSGTPTAPTPPTDDDSDRIATTAFVDDYAAGIPVGINQLEGDVTAGPGSGLQSATLAAIQGVDLAITSLTSGDVLTYNGTDWVNEPSASSVTLSLSYNGVGPFSVPVSSLPAGWSGSGIASMLAQLTTGEGLVTGLLDQSGNPIPDGWSFPATIFVEGSVIYDIIALNPWTANGGGIVQWGPSGNLTSMITFNSIILPFIPTSDPGVTGELWSDGGTVVLSGSSASGIKSLTGDGVSETPGQLNQAGGLTVVDQESDGFFVTTDSTVGLYAAGDIELSTLAQSIGLGAAGGTIQVGVAYGAAMVASSGPVLPITVVTGVNDTFTYTPVGTGIPEVFTVAAGTDSTLAELFAALNAATGTSSDTFSDYGTFQQSGNGLYVNGGSIAVGDTLTSGPTDILASIGFTSGVTAAQTSDTVTLVNSLFIDPTSAGLASPDNTSYLSLAQAGGTGNLTIDGSLQIAASSGVQISGAGSTVAVGEGGDAVTIASSSGGTLGFFATTPVAQPGAPSSAQEFYDSIASTGLIASGGTIPGGGGAPGTTVESYINSPVDVTGETSTDVTSVSLGAGTWLVIARASITNAQSGEEFEVAAWLSPASATFTDAYAGASMTLPDLATSTPPQQELVVSKSITLTEETTIYFSVRTGLYPGSVVIQATDSVGLAIPNVSGITAVQTA
jgi:hypothetical protein